MNNMLAIIPARLKSERFPNKLFAEIDGEKIIDKVINNVLSAQIADHLIVATDSQEVATHCKNRNIEYFYMWEQVGCGSERSYHVWKKYPNYDWYVSFPSDEPMLDHQEINKMWFKHLEKQYGPEDFITTCYTKFYDKNRIELNRSCKIVSHDDNVLYFSRSPIPYSKNGLLPIEEYKQHIGIFIFHPCLFKRMDFNNINYFVGDLAKKEGLEQISFLEHGLSIKLIEMVHKSHGVDIPQDLEDL